MHTNIVLYSNTVQYVTAHSSTFVRMKVPIKLVCLTVVLSCLQTTRAGVRLNPDPHILVPLPIAARVCSGSHHSRKLSRPFCIANSIPCCASSTCYLALRDF